VANSGWRPNDDELVHFLDAVSASATRVRQVLIVMSTASIIVFAAVWNSVEFSWLRWRGEVATTLEIWTTYQQDDKEKKRWDAQKEKAASGQATKVEREQLATWQKKLATGEKYAGGAFLPLTQIKELAKKQREMVLDSATVIRIPFFGVVIDSNDTTLVGGFTLVIILMWLRLSLWRQCSNLSMAFSQAETVHRLEFAYRYVSMQQVLSVPPPTADGDRRTRPKHGAPPILFWLAAIVQAIALAFDLMTFDAVRHETTTYVHAVVQTIVAGYLLAVIIVLTLQCHQLRNEVNTIWHGYFAKLTAVP
jgi:hypothetical protein